PPSPNRFSSFRQRLQDGQLLIRRNMQGRFKKSSSRSLAVSVWRGDPGVRSLPACGSQKQSFPLLAQRHASETLVRRGRMAGGSLFFLLPSVPSRSEQNGH